ncbi:uncharacterized protein LOC115162615 [Salmo trutta]|uniref:uncharacterized protein LOC115162615 n=1 Tax=Salmo trutta TaxID=8032 RepID=UPI00112FDD15|nr:uncharacterized protein LOC115162615 [Salmo trutta]XP_029569955.1 uncharacterized protein LOC115162615 [Salmo trutta]
MNFVKSGYRPGSMTHQTIFTVDHFKFFEDMKVLAPGCSRQAFVGMLDGRTKYFDRSGKICGDTFQKAFLEWTYGRFEIDKLCGINLLHCPACSQEMHAISVDGNHKQYCFRKASECEKTGGDQPREKRAELDINNAVLQEWVAEVQQWPDDTLQDSQTGHLQKKLEGLYLSVKEETLLLPFHSSHATAILPSKGNLDRLMLVNRLQEEERILVQEMRH